jgi:hypothetical protein
MAEIPTLIAHIREELKGQGLSDDQIASIDPEITEVATECDKEVVNKGVLHTIFSKIKEKAGPVIGDFVANVTAQILMKKLGA